MFPKYPQHRTKRDKNSKPAALPKKEKPTEPDIPASTVPEYDIAETIDKVIDQIIDTKRTQIEDEDDLGIDDDDDIDTNDTDTNDIDTNDKKDGKGTSFSDNYEGGVLNKGGRPLLEHEQKNWLKLEKYYRSGIGPLLAAEQENLSIKTVRKYFRRMRNLSLLGMEKDWVDEARKQKADTMMMFDRWILKFTVMLNSIEKSLKSWDEDEERRRVNIEIENEKIVEANKTKSPSEKEMLKTRQPQIAYGLLKKQQEYIASLAELTSSKASLGMQPTAADHLDDYFKKVEKKNKEFEEELKKG